MNKLIINVIDEDVIVDNEGFNVPNISKDPLLKNVRYLAWEAGETYVLNIDGTNKRYNALEASFNVIIAKFNARKNAVVAAQNQAEAELINSMPKEIKRLNYLRSISNREPTTFEELVINVIKYLSDSGIDVGDAGTKLINELNNAKNL